MHPLGTRRNVAEDTEESLLRMQEEFFVTKQTPAATVIRRAAPPILSSSTATTADTTNTSTPPSVPFAASPVQRDTVTLSDIPTLESIVHNPAASPKPKKKSIFATQREAQQQAVHLDESAQEKYEPHVPAIKRVLDMNSLMTGVLGAVSEREINTLASDQRTTFVAPKTGFPEPIHRTEFNAKKSRFKAMQEVKKDKKSDNEMQIDHSGNVVSPPMAGLQKDTNKSLYEQIHEENVKRINHMSEEEIENARAELFAQFNPLLLEKLMQRKPLAERGAGKEDENILHGINPSFEAGDIDDEDIIMDGDEEIPSENTNSKRVRFEEPTAIRSSAINNDENYDPEKFKERYFPDVPAEVEKLAWMTEMDSEISVPLSNSDITSLPLRFDFIGTLLRPEESSEIPTYKGLHHHGENPTQPGYTLAELVHLMRSQVTGQRVLSLQVFGRIIRKVKSCDGIDEEVVDKVISELDHLKVAVYIRSALDDRNDGVVIAAVGALANWVLDDDRDGESEDVELDRWEKVWEGTERGYEYARIMPTKNINRGEPKGLRKIFGMTMKQQGGESGAFEDDDDAERDDGSIERDSKKARQNLLEALLDMDIVHRMHYLLERFSGSVDDKERESLPSRTNDQILTILFRLARDTTRGAADIMSLDGFVDMLWHRFGVQGEWPIVGKARPPNLLVFRLISVLIQASRELATKLLSIADDLLRFLLVAHNDSAIALCIQIEALHIYKCLAAYGFHCHVLNEFYSSALIWVNEVQLSSKAPMESLISRLKTRKLAVFFGLLEQYLHCAADTRRTTPPHAICWAQPAGLVPLAVDILAASSSLGFDSASQINLGLMAAAMGCISAWCRYLDMNPPLNGEEEVVHVWEEVATELFFKSIVLHRLDSLLERDDYQLGYELPNIAGVYNPAMKLFIHQLADEVVLHDLLIRYLSFVFYAGRLVPKFLAARAIAILTYPKLVHIMDILARKPKKDSRHWTNFLMRHRYFIPALWSIATRILLPTVFTVPNQAQERQRWMKECFIVARASIGRTLPGDAWIAKGLILNILLDSEVLSEIVEEGEIQRELLKSFHGILEPFYTHVLGSNAQLRHSKGLCTHDGRDIVSLALDFVIPKVDPDVYNEDTEGHVLLPISDTWPFFPIEELYRPAKSTVLRMLPDGYTFKDEEVLIASLIFARVLNGVRLDNDADEKVLNRAEVLIELMKVFMIGAQQDEGGFGNSEVELYRNSKVEAAVKWWLDLFSQPSISTDISMQISPTLTLEDAWYTTEPPATSIPFFQFFTDFTANYAAASYGHTLFARLLLPPLAASYPSDYKHLVWNDLFDLLRTIRVPMDEIPFITTSSGYHSYLYPLERHISVLRFYLRAVLEGMVTADMGALYWIALHHLNGAAFDEKENLEGNMGRDICVAIVRRAKLEVIRDWIEYEFVETNKGWVGKAEAEVVKERESIVKEWVPEFIVINT